MKKQTMQTGLNIQMADLYGQYLAIKDEVDTAIQEVISSSVFVKGGKVTDFERHLGEYLQTNVVTCGNGTDALQIAFMALGLSPGDEVVTTPFTFVATAETLALLGLKPVFVDVCEDTFNIDPAKLEEAISPCTRAILPVHLFGQSAPMEIIMSVAHKYNLAVVEDAAQSLGTDYYFSNGDVKKSGTIGHIGCTSFFPSKTLGAFGDGGAIFTADTDLSKKIRSIANHGMKARYVYERVGMNSRLDSIQAAILDVKLNHLSRYITARQQAAAFYDKELVAVSGVKVPKRAGYSSHTFHQYTLLCDRRDELQQYLKDNHVPTMIYYPRCLHLQQAYRFLGYHEGSFPVAEALSRKVLSLPMHTELDHHQLSYITTMIIKFFEQDI